MASFPTSLQDGIESIQLEPCEVGDDGKFVELGTRIIAALSTISLMVFI